MPTSQTPPSGAAPADPDEVWTFAVVADTHVNAQSRGSTSPWKANALANPRAVSALSAIADANPDFVLHLGDIVHPVPSHRDYDEAVATFKAMVEPLSMPVHLVAGNHDVGDKPMAWTPAEIVTPAMVTRYEEHLGPSSYFFDHRGCRFVALNAQIINSGFDLEMQQWEWLEETLASAPTLRRFVFLHYPPFIVHPDEPGNYDNLDEPGRSRLLEILTRHHVEALFAGHVHNFFYTRYRDLDIYCAPATSFVRNDYHEFAKTTLPVECESGRNDVAKLGHFLIEMRPEGHVPVIRRSYGDVGTAVHAHDVGSNGPAWRLTAPCAVDLRHDWAEEIDIPYMGGVDEFARKRARNDYPLLALWELGIGLCRVPIHDLTDERTRARMVALHTKGYRFIAFTLDAPSPRQLEMLARLRPMVAALEVILPDIADSQAVESLAAVQEMGIEIAYSRLLRHGEIKTASQSYSHSINHGYVPAELTAQTLGDLAGAGVHRLVVRLGSKDDPLATFMALDPVATGLGIRLQAQVRMAGEVPTGDELTAAQARVRLARALVAGLAYPDHHVVLDNLMEHDRGYFRRPGLIDRNNNPTGLGNMVRSIARIFADVDECRVLEDSPSATLIASPNSTFQLVYPNEPISVSQAAATYGSPDGATARAVVDLARGQYHVADAEGSEQAPPLDGPYLLIYPTPA